MPADQWACLVAGVPWHVLQHGVSAHLGVILGGRAVRVCALPHSGGCGQHTPVDKVPALRARFTLVLVEKRLQTRRAASRVTAGTRWGAW